MPAAELHFYDADDPNGATIFECSTDDEFVKSIELDIQRDSLGSGKVTFARKVGVGLFTRQIVVPEVLVRVLIPAVHPTKYYTGFWINPRQQQVISKDEQGGEGFTFAGPGPKHYLERMILWSASFTGIDSAVDKEAGIWRWPETAVAGRILDRLLAEDQANPSGPFLPDLHASFDDTDDSDGNPWTEDVSDADGSFILRISDDYLKLLWTIEDVSGLTSQIYLGEVGDPVIRLDAFQSFGRDLTGPIGASTVHFTEGVNISTDLDVEGSSYRKASHALVRGTDGVYNLAFKPSWSPGDLKKVVGTEFDSNSGAVLDRAGERFLTRQDDGEDQIDLKIVTGFDPESGLYMPGPDYIGSAGHFWVGDSVSLTTGQSEQTALDYDDDTEIVTGIELELEEAVRDDIDEQAARSFAVTVHLNEQRKSNHTARDLAGNRGTVPPAPNVLQLCQPGIIGETEVNIAFSSACSSSGTNFASDYPPWTGDNEERVEVTAAADIPAGYTLIAVVTNTKIHALTLQVYDEQGNTWVLDEEHENTSSSEDDYVAIWRTIVTNPISAGDYVRFAANLGGGLLPSSEMNKRCIGVYAFAGELTSPVPGTPDDDFSGSATINTPAGDIVVAALTIDLDGAVTPSDPDWLAMVPFDSNASGVNYRTILGQYRADTSATTFTSDWTGGSSDWSAISCAYDFAPIEAENNPRDGNPALVGTDVRASRCDHRHDVHMDTEPTVDDDETLGYKVGTIWAVLDSLATPTTIESVWVLLDDATGAAVWAEWPSGGSTPSGSILVPDLLNSPAPGGGCDAEFSGTIAPFSAIDGSSGTVSLNAGSGAGLYDVATRSGWILMQFGTASGDGVDLKQDYTLPDGKCIVAYLSPAIDQAGTAAANNELQFGIGVNDNDTSILSGTTGQTMIALFDNEASGAIRVLGFDGTNNLGEMPGSNTSMKGFFARIDRSGLVYRAFASYDGFAWSYIGSKTMATAANNVWLFARCAATTGTRMVVGSPWFREGTALAVDPFPLT